ncbi:STAS domain-containing protein [Rubrobacter aplysinae]|uniref:STAS domain-containing protein n=1 Tax=Rubrobacter aplysinae TaxID=909625 RepID=UPI001364B22C|nr:STAS domain-containing protein [Rubrobacter aplysinae]
MSQRGGVRVIELYGEFDIDSLRDLSDVLRREAASGRAVSVDLSGVAFADVRTMRELSEALLSYPRLSLCSPSWQVMASVHSCGLEDRMSFEPAVSGASGITGITRKAS